MKRIVVLFLISMSAHGMKKAGPWKVDAICAQDVLDFVRGQEQLFCGVSAGQALFVKNNKGMVAMRVNAVKLWPLTNAVVRNQGIFEDRGTFVVLLGIAEQKSAPKPDEHTKAAQKKD
jgi:hypothetical protein